jgi:pimeloyl-ACP methyl ester carboxylesterase
MFSYYNKCKVNKNINIIEKIQLGGINQWISIRGHDRSNPILLFLHGGPGATCRYYNYQLGKIFIIVNWDQRGAGKSYSSEVTKDSMNIEQFLSDTNELVEYLKKKFNKNKIFLVGHSWGSFLGISTVYKYPDNFYAYIGIGQVVNGRSNEQISYDYTLNMEKKYKNNHAIEELTTISKMKDGLYCNGRTGIHVERKWLYRLGKNKYKKSNFYRCINIMISRKIFSPKGRSNYKKGLNFSAENLWGWMDNVDLFSQIPQIKIPTFFLTGRYDYVSSFELVNKYYNQLEAPLKELIWFERSSHSPHIEEPDIFYDVMNRILNITINRVP